MFKLGKFFFLILLQLFTVKIGVVNACMNVNDNEMEKKLLLQQLKHIMTWLLKVGSGEPRTEFIHAPIWHSWQKTLCYTIELFQMVVSRYEPRHVISNNMAFWHEETQTSMGSLLLSLETQMMFGQ